jgi:hypothetical protein
VGLQSRRHAPLIALLPIYVVGVLIGLVVMRDPIGSRLLTAAVWPLGPMAFVIVLTILLAVSAVLWPVGVLGTAAVVGAIVWLVT